MKRLAASMFLALFWLGATSAPCGWDFTQAITEGLPLTYCFAKQVRGHETFNGKLNLPCEGATCSVSNTTSSVL